MLRNVYAYGAKDKYIYINKRINILRILTKETLLYTTLVISLNCILYQVSLFELCSWVFFVFKFKQVTELL